MQNNQTKNKINFTGKGSEFFGIWILNAFLTFLTIGLYYPWAKASTLKYIYSNVELDGHKFTFHGTGNEMFWGFVKVLVLLATVFAVMIFVGPYGIFAFYGILFLITPFAMHSSMKYRLSRTSYKGIHFGYTGDLNEFVLLYFKNILITIFTFGIYSSWMRVNLRQYMVGNAWYGDANFQYNANGSDLFIINLKGFFLSIFTLYIYIPWYIKDLYKFYIDNITLHHKENEYQFNSDLDGGNLFGTIILNYLQTVFTLFLGTPWVEMRTIKLFVGSISVFGDLEQLNVTQTQEQYIDAMGDDMNDFLDIGIV
jgi:uncharacterized membrane protein YjgN (DUF898 family)